MKKIFILGQSLFEVMVAIGIASLVLIAIVGLSTRAVKNSDFSRNNALASKYAQEGLEWVRQQRDSSWTNLTGQTPNVDINLGSTSNWGSANPILNTVFYRTIRLIPDVWPNPTSYTVQVKVTWEDGSGPHEVTNNTKLTNWRK